jgi:hypothetical protein
MGGLIIRRFSILLFLVITAVFAQFVDFTVTTQTYYGHFRPANCMAVWITDANDTYIKTLLIGANIPPDPGFRNSLLTWVPASNWDSTDAITSATYSGHATRNITWDCTNISGNEVPNGNYKLVMEMTETNSHLNPTWGGPVLTVPFTKGASDATVTPGEISFTDQDTSNWQFGTPQSPFTNMTLTYSAPGPGVLQFKSNVFAQREGKGDAVITVIRKKGKTGQVSVKYALRDSTARAGSDYTTASGTLVFNNNDYSPKTFTVPVTDDGNPEGTEAVVVELSTPAGGAGLGSPLQAVLYLFDNDVSVPQNGLVGHWDFEEGAGTQVLDGSGNNNLGTIYQETWTTGRKGGGLNFRGVDDYIEVSGSSSLSITGPITVAAWIYPRKNNFAQTYIRSPGQYVLWVQLDNQVRFADALGHWVDTPGNVLQLNKWNHVVGLFTGTLGTGINLNNIKVYVNGTSRGNQVSGAWYPNVQSKSTVTIGVPGFDGILDEVYIYNRALQVSEILALHADTLKPVVDQPRISNEDNPGLSVFPNPFRPSTRIAFSQPTGPWNLLIFDLSGRLVYVRKNIRIGKVYWRPQNIPSGVYTAKAFSENRKFVKKLLLVK